MRAATGTSVDLTHAEFGAVRKLLEDQQTWSTVIGRGTVEDLAGRIAACLRYAMAGQPKVRMPQR